MSFDYSEVDLFSTQECLLNSGDCIRNTSGGIRKNVSKLLNNDLSLITHEEREAIREIIDKKFPLLAIPPVLKLLGVIGFSQTSQRYGKLQYNLNEYEVVRTVANCGPMRGKNLDAILLPDLLYEGENPVTGGMVKRLIQSLKDLFPEVKMEFSSEGIKTSILTHEICPGYRNSPIYHQDLYYDGSVLAAWIDNGLSGTVMDSQFAWYNNHYFSNHSSGYDRRAGFTLVPTFCK